MNIDWKRIGIITGFALVAIGMGYLLYRIFFAPSTPEPVSVTEPVPGEPGLPVPGDFIAPPPGEEPTGELPIPTTVAEAQGGPVRVTEIQSDRNSTIQISSNGTDVVGYNAFDGRFYRITPDGQSVALSDQTFVGADTIAWSPQSDKAIIEFFDGNNILYNFETGEQATLPAHWREFEFSPGGDQLAFKSLTSNPENNWLAISRDDGTEGKQIEPLGRNAGLVDVNWSPSNQVIATFREGIDGDRQRVYFIGQNGENFKATVVEGRGLVSEWSPNGDRLLYSVYSADTDYRPTLWVVDAIGDEIGNNRRSLSIYTWADKCTFASNDVAYCAVPASLGRGAGLLRIQSDTAPDHLYRINISTGETVKLAEPLQARTIEELVVSDDERYLYFTDKDSGKLFKVDLQ